MPETHTSDVHHPHHHQPLWKRLGKAETYLDNLALILILVLGVAVAVGMFVAQGDIPGT